METDQYILPNYVDLSFPIDRVIFDNKLPYQPIVPSPVLPVGKLVPSINIERNRGEMFGYTEENYLNSAFLSIATILKFYGVSKDYDLIELKKVIALEVKKQPFLRNKLRDLFFEESYLACNNYLKGLENGTGNFDSEEILANAVSLAFRRPVIMIYAKTKYSPKGILISKINTGKYKTPPIVLGVERYNGEPVYLPYM